MSRLQQIHPNEATGWAKELLDAVKSKMGMVPNMTRAMANGPAALNGYLQFGGALSGGELDAKERELVALAVGQENGCDYCLAAHTTVGKMVGLTEEQIRDARAGDPADDRYAALVRFTRRVVETRCRVDDADLDQFHAAGYGDAAVAEVVGNVALNVFTNYFNHVAGTDVDFPKAPDLKPAAAGATCPTECGCR